jgi:uncharacterized protein (DUF488 family)
MSLGRLYTMGYEGLNIDDFIVRLKEAGVESVVDVRAIPISRKKGFSKTAFSSKLQEAGIDYLHIAALGCPKSVRNTYREDGDWNSYTRGFLAYLNTQQQSVVSLAKLSRSSVSCLVCFEADFNYCHRSLVARAAVSFGAAQIAHITRETVILEQPAMVAA